MSYTIEQLQEARDALHLRMRGLQPISTKYDGREVTYGAVSVRDMQAYIARMERALGVVTAPSRRTFAAERGLR